MLLQLGVYFSGFYMHFLLFTKARCDGNFEVRVFHDFRLRKFMLVPRPVVRCSHFPIVCAIIVRHWGNSLPHFYKKKLLVLLSFNQKWAAGSNCGRKIRAISQYSNREITFQLTKCPGFASQNPLHAIHINSFPELEISVIRFRCKYYALSCLVFVRRLPRNSRWMHLGDVKLARTTWPEAYRLHWIMRPTNFPLIAV